MLLNMGNLKSVYIHESSSTAEMREINHANFGLFGEPHLTKKQVYFLFINLHHANTKHNIQCQSVDNDDNINNIVILILTVAQCQTRELISHALVAIFVNAQNGSHADQPHKYNVFLPKIPEILCLYLRK